MYVGTVKFLSNFYENRDKTMIKSLLVFDQFMLQISDVFDMEYLEGSTNN